MDSRGVQRWQGEWARAGLATGQRDSRRGKFYALVAYPGSSGFLHVGHLRAYAYADALHRYHRALGESVLFPFGLHASGLPAVTWARRLKARDPSVVRSLEDAGVPPPVWPALETPEEAARFLGEEYQRVLRTVGVLVDESTYLTTIDDDYRRFVQWQLRTLHAAGEVVQGSYYSAVCPVCGPIAVDASETDLDSGGDAEVIRFTLVPFRLDDGRTLLAATLRPETIYGVTNVWVAPDEELVIWHLGSEEFLIARAGGDRLVDQHGGRLGRVVPAAELVRRTVHVPITGGTVPILTSSLVDPAIGTGVVMSVPAHAPADAAAVAELSSAERDALGPPPILLDIAHDPPLTVSEEALTQGDGTPAEKALRATRARGLSDREAVEAATERLYRLEFVRGTMTVESLRGISVREARDRVAKSLADAGSSLQLQEFSKPVICRNGHAVVIRKVSDQWFLRYSDPEWKARTLEAARTLVTWPPEYAHELPGIIEWFADRPCARKGPWLGTPFPLDPSWTLEPIADSTFYMAFFIVRRFLAAGRLRPEQLTDAFFDHVFRGVGSGEPSIPAGLQAEVREEFLYWYPLDINMGGHEHKSVHFPVFVYTHARLVAPELRPRGIYVNGWITGPSGTKISKKDVSVGKGRIPSIYRALERWGPDALRLYYVSAASPSADVEWNPETVDAALARLLEVERLVRETRGQGRGPPELDAWLLSRMHQIITRVRDGLGRADLRPVAEEVYVTVPAVIRRYYARGGVAGEATDKVGRAWTLLLGPITPHLAEEVGDGRFDGLVATQPFPSPSDFPSSEPAEAREEYLQRVEDDLRAVLRPSSERGDPTPGAAIFFIASPWKAVVERWMREAVARGETPSVRAIMERVQTHPELTGYRTEIPKYVQRVAPLLRSEPAIEPPSVEEDGTLRAAEAYLVRRFGFGSVGVYPEDEGAGADPLGRRDRSRPGKPAFYLVRPGAPKGTD
ncbi:MAG: class I tRNA ligase family protein [Thermoplasmata archaeon]|nr:class I tRNA ligase family protein [Thermoplasmata archaeon]